MSGGYVRLDHSGSAPELSYLNRPTDWVKSSFSGNCGCIEVQRQFDGSVLIRNSNRPEEWIQDTAQAWDAFVAGVRAGEFDHLGGAS